MNKKVEYALFAFLALIILGVGAMVFDYVKKPGNVEQAVAPTTSKQTGGSLGSQIYTQGSNPVPDALPDTNPLNTRINPFE